VSRRRGRVRGRGLSDAGGGGAVQWLRVVRMTTMTKPLSNTDLLWFGLSIVVAVIVRLLVPTIPGWDHTIFISIILLALGPWMLVHNDRPWRVVAGLFGGIALVAFMERVVGVWSA
jgi:hypothetical protein